MKESFVRKAFFRNFWANSFGGLEGSEIFFTKNFLASLSLFIFSFILSLLLSCIFSLLVFSLLFSSLSSSLVFSRLSSFIFSFLLFSCLVFSSLVLSCLFFLCLSLSLSVSLCFCLSLSLSNFCFSLSLSVSVSVWCCVLWCVSWSWCCCWSWCVFVCVCVCCGTLKNVKKKPCVDSKMPPCVHSKRPRVCRHHVHMCFNMYAWCRYTRGRFKRTHGDVSNPHTEGRGSSLVLLTKICPRMVTTWFRGSLKKPVDLHYFHLRTGREQHVANSSKHSLCLIKLFSFSNPEGHCRGNQLWLFRFVSSLLSLLSLLHHNPQRKQQQHARPKTKTRTRTCACTCACTCVSVSVSVCVLRESACLWPSTMVSCVFATSLLFFKYKYIYIYINMSSWTVTDATTFEMELCGCKQATAHAHLQPHGVWLNFEHTKNSNP